MDVLKRRYLAQMGIPVWQRRRLPIAAATPAAASSVAAEASAVTDSSVADETVAFADPSVAVPNRVSSGVAATAEADAAALWRALEAEVAACTRCALHRGRKQTVFGVGRRDAPLLVVGEAPGAEEDRQGEPFVGPAGQLLNAMLGAIGFAREDVFIANVLKCRPPSNRDPSSGEALACSDYLERQIALVQPRAMLAVGRIAAQWLLQSETPIGRLRGSIHRYGDVPLVVTYHPAYLLRTPSAKAKSWQDLCMIRQLVHIQP